jgi:hypothetical protein
MMGHVISMGMVKMSHMSVCRWVAKLKAAYELLKDVGRPATVTNNNSVIKIHQILRKRRKIYREAIGSDMTNFSLARVHGILKKNIKLIKINARWISHLKKRESVLKRQTYYIKKKQLYTKYPRPAPRIFDHFTGDWTFVYYFEPKSKGSSKILASEYEKCLSIAKRLQP